MVQRVVVPENAARTGWEEMVGAVGEVRAPLNPVGQVFVEGALWRAMPAADEKAIALGNRVRVESVDGLTLRVRSVNGGEPESGEGRS